MKKNIYIFAGAFNIIRSGVRFVQYFRAAAVAIQCLIVGSLTISTYFFFYLVFISFHLIIFHPPHSIAYQRTFVTEKMLARILHAIAVMIFGGTTTNWVAQRHLFSHFCLFHVNKSHAEWSSLAFQFFSFLRLWLLLLLWLLLGWDKMPPTLPQIGIINEMTFIRRIQPHWWELLALLFALCLFYGGWRIQYWFGKIHNSWRFVYFSSILMYCFGSDVWMKASHS